jgi:signal transduction histidine kinase
MRPRPLPWVIFGIALAVVAIGNIVGEEPLDWDMIWFLPFVAYGAVGALVASFRPENRIGWVFLAVWVFGALASLWVVADLLQGNPRWGPVGTALGLLSVAGWFGGLGTMLTIGLLLFPDGRLPGSRWKVVLWGALVTIPVAAIAEHLGSDVAAAPDPVASVARPVAGIALAFFVGVALASVASVVVRFRRSRGDERVQLKWFTYAAALVLAGIALTVAAETVEGTETSSPLVVVSGLLLALTVTGIPVSAGIAILRHRLYDINLVISKTLIYGALAAFITTVYVGIVVGLGTLIGTQGELNLPLQIVATALVAVAFQPVRSRVQRLANRLVYGKRSSPYEVLAGFSDKVAGTYAAEDVLPRMARVVADGTGAVEASVWLRVGEELRRAARFPPGDGGPASVTDVDVEAVPDADRALPIRHRGELLGALAVRKQPGDPLRPQEEALLEHLASQAGLVLRNVGLTEQLRGRLEETTRLATELRHSRRRIVATQDAARRRLERNIHDGAQQHLVALAVNLKLARTMVAKDPERARALVGQLRERTAESLDVLRDLARGIYPAALEAGGLGVALREAAERSSVPVEIDADGARYPIEVEAAVYFSILEALQNAAKYAEASRVRVRLAESDGSLTFEVADDGLGFDQERASKGAGLQNMADRLAAFQGAVTIESAPGSGTVVRGRVALAAEATSR